MEKANHAAIRAIDGGRALDSAMRVARGPGARRLHRRSFAKSMAVARVLPHAGRGGLGQRVLISPAAGDRGLLVDVVS